MQRALISAAFAGDDVASEFAATKAEEVEGELPKVDVPVMLPGWGAWNGQQREPKFMKDARIKAAKDKEKVRLELYMQTVFGLIGCQKKGAWLMRVRHMQ